MNPLAKQLLPFLFIFAILSISTASIFIRLAQADRMPSLVIAALRLIIATTILAPYAISKHHNELRKFTATEMLICMASGVLLALHFAAWITSLQYSSVAISAILVNTSPLWVAIFSTIFLNERLRRYSGYGLVLAFIGCLLISISQFQSFSITSSEIKNFTPVAISPGGFFLALSGALAFSGYLIIGRKVRPRFSLIPYIFIVYGFAAIVLTMMMLTAGYSPFGYKPITYLWILLLAVIPQLAGHTIFNWALKFMPTSLVAVSTLGEPLGSALLAFMILRETISLNAVIGGLLILTGIVFVSLSENRRRP